MEQLPYSTLVPGEVAPCIPASTPISVGSILRLDKILILISLIVSTAFVMM